jgi:hypothetical protein
VFLIAAGCGGGDVTPIDGGNEGSIPGMDGAVGPDSGTPDDSGNPNNDGGNNDSGNTNDGAASDGGNFNVGAVSCVVLWLDAAKGVTQMNNFVSKWADQSGKGNDAQQPTGTRQPGVVANGINALPSIHFNQGNQNGNVLIINDSATMQWGTGDFAVWVVARYNNATMNSFNTALMFSKTAQGMGGFTGPFLVGNYFANNQIVAGLQGGISGNNVLQQGAAYNDAAPRAFGLRRTGTSIELRVNGAAVATVMQNGNVDVSTPTTPARIGADDTQAQFRRMNGDISEVIGCKGAISAQDLAGVDGYLKGKYNL